MFWKHELIRFNWWLHFATPSFTDMVVYFTNCITGNKLSLIRLIETQGPRRKAWVDSALPKLLETTMEQATFEKSAFLKSFHQWSTKLHYNCHTMNIWYHSGAGSLLPKSSNGFQYAGLRISGCGHTLLTSLKNQSSVSSGPLAKVAVVPDTEVPGKRDSQLEGANPIFLLVCEVKGTELFCFKQLSVSQFCCTIFPREM